MQVCLPLIDVQGCKKIVILPHLLELLQLFEQVAGHGCQLCATAAAFSATTRARLGGVNVNKMGFDTQRARQSTGSDQLQSTARHEHTARLAISVLSAQWIQHEEYWPVTMAEVSKMYTYSKTQAGAVSIVTRLHRAKLTLLSHVHCTTRNVRCCRGAERTEHHELTADREQSQPTGPALIALKSMAEMEVAIGVEPGSEEAEVSAAHSLLLCSTTAKHCSSMPILAISIPCLQLTAG
jgi:hypothetical protein